MARKNKSGKRLKRPLSTKQETYFKLLCKGVPATQAALKAGYTAKSPAQAAYAARRSIQDRVQNALFQAGLTPEGLIHKHLVPALAAEQTEYCKFEGQITDTRNEINWSARLRAIELTIELGGYAASEANTDKYGRPLDMQPIKYIDVSKMRAAPQLKPPIPGVSVPEQ